MPSIPWWCCCLTCPCDVAADVTFAGVTMIGTTFSDDIYDFVFDGSFLNDTYRLAKPTITTACIYSAESSQYVLKISAYRIESGDEGPRDYMAGCARLIGLGINRLSDGRYYLYVGVVAFADFTQFNFLVFFAVFDWPTGGGSITVDNAVASLPPEFDGAGRMNFSGGTATIVCSETPGQLVAGDAVDDECAVVQTPPTTLPTQCVYGFVGSTDCFGVFITGPELFFTSCELVGTRAEGWFATGPAADGEVPLTGYFYGITTCAGDGDAGCGDDIPTPTAPNADMIAAICAGCLVDPPADVIYARISYSTASDPTVKNERIALTYAGGYAWDGSYYPGSPYASSPDEGAGAPLNVNLAGGCIWQIQSESIQTRISGPTRNGTGIYPGPSGGNITFVGTVAVEF